MMNRIRLPQACGLLFAAFLVVPDAFAEVATGTVLPHKRVIVSSPVLQEVIEKFFVEEGDEVKAEQVLLQLKSTREKLEVRQAEKQVELQQFKSLGAENMAKDKMISKEKVLEQRTELELANIIQEAARSRLDEKTVRAPIAGIVVKKHKEAGETVDRVEKLLEIINIDQVLVRFFLEGSARQHLKDGDVVQVKIPDLGGDTFTAKVEFIAPELDAASKKLQVKVSITNADHKIKPGMEGVMEFRRN
jgi:membrane fusion protein (multidrug efflux system)